MDLRKLVFICCIFTVLGCTKAASKPSDANTPEYSETQENKGTYLWDDDEAWAEYISSLRDPQTSNKMLIDYLEKQNKTASYLL